MGFIEEFQNRGYFYQATHLDKLRDLSNKEKITAYIGFDSTADSLHVGNLMQVMILRLLQQHGHKPIVIIGGATTKIGDPSGKDELRKYLDDKQISKNIAGIKESLSKFIRFGDEPSDALLLNNSDWLDKLNYIDFLRDFGRKFSVNRMLTMDSVRLRLEREQPLSFLEFNYMLLQSYDFMHLFKHHNCVLQIGGSDQWGNIVSGSDLIHKELGKQAYGLTTPLLTTASGAKMGKSASGAVWLNSAKLQPYDYFQFWRNTDDADVSRFAKIYCEFSGDQESEFNNLLNSNINEAKKMLAHRATELCHGRQAADDALETAIKTFEQGQNSANLPTVLLQKEDIENGIEVVDALIKTGFAASKGEAKRLIKGGGCRVNDVVVYAPDAMISGQDLANSACKISAGKKRHALLKTS